MCSIFYIDGHRFSNCGKLQEYLGKKRKIPISEGYLDKKTSYNECLCPVDVQSLVNMLGQRAVTDSRAFYFGDQADKVPEERLCGRPYEIEK